MSKAKALAKAKQAACGIKADLEVIGAPHVAVILGTGWGDALELEQKRERPFSTFPGFEGLGALEGHDRVVMYGRICGTNVIALRGRVHLNEHPTDPNIPMMVRLQMQMLCELGVKRFVLTNAAGSLVPSCKVGSIVVADGFVTTQIAQAMPLFAGEFCSPEDRLDPELRDLAFVSAEQAGLAACKGGYALMRGPYFEGRKYDKNVIRATGATAVGMSTFPEVCVLSTYPDTQAVCLSYITNSAYEEHSHEVNQARAKEQAAALGTTLRLLIAGMKK